MINTIKRLFGIHVHEWGPYGETYSQDFTSTTPIIAERVIGVDAWDDDIIEEYETGEVEVRNWTETFQDRKCSTCGLQQTISV
jgi:hypothetical protein